MTGGGEMKRGGLDERGRGHGDDRDELGLVRKVREGEGMKRRD